jgi:hypothetical protein
MFKGFGTETNRDTDWVISNIQKNRKELRNNFTDKRDLMVKGWYEKFKNEEYAPASIEQLFSPYDKHSCMIAETPKRESVAGKHNEQIIFFANSDFWSVLVRRENSKLKMNKHRLIGTRPAPKIKQDHYEFQFGVKVGLKNFLMPSLIKERICDWHGGDIYESWRKMVKADLHNLVPYMSAFNPPKHLYSFTCDDSSARVCESLGLPVKHGVAYWLRQANADLKSEVVAEVVKGTAVSGLNLQMCFGQQGVSLTQTVANYLKYGPGNLLDFSKMLEAA